MDMTVVYEAEFAVYRQVLDVLYKAGLNPEIVEDVSRMSEFTGKSKCTTRINIVVSSDEVAMAKVVLEKWEMENEQAVESLTKGVSKNLFNSIFVTAIAALVLLWMGLLEEIAGLLVFVWIVSFVVLANSKKAFKFLTRTKDMR